MTDPATLAPGELAEAVCRALGWVKRTHPDLSVIITRPWEAPNGERYKHPLDFHSEAERWRSFGVLAEHVYARGGGVEIESRDCEHDGAFDEITVWPDGARAEAMTPQDWPAALAIAYLRACAAEGGAG